MLPFNLYVYVPSGRSWRTVWTRLSQGENQCGFGFSPKPGLCQTAKQAAVPEIAECGFGLLS